MKNKKHWIWATALVLIFGMICGTLIWLNYHSWTLRFEMDDNTKEAIQSIDFNSLNNPQKECYKEECKWDVANNIISGCSLYKEDCSILKEKYGVDIYEQGGPQ